MYAITKTGYRTVWEGFTEKDLNEGETLVSEITPEVISMFEINKAPSKIATRRYLAEVSGMTHTGIFIDTGRDSQGLILGAALSAVIDPSYTCNWKTSNGFVLLDAQSLISIAQAIRSHVQACFDREAALLDLVEKGTFKEYLLEKGWPEY